MREKVHKVDLRADEFLAAVSGEMSPSELGVYWMICLLQYAKGDDIADDMDLLRAKFRPNNGNRVVSDIVEKLISTGRVYRVESQLGVSRCRVELESALSRIRVASESGGRGGRPRNKNNDIADPYPFSDEKLTTNHQPPTTTDANASDATNSELPTNAKRSRRKPTGPIPPDWQPREADRELAFGLGLNVEAVVAEFVDYWVGEGVCKADWDATFRNRCRQIADRRAGSARGGSGGSGSGNSRIAAALDRVHIDAEISGPH